MKTFVLRREQYLPVRVEEAWAFFSSAGNLSKITPPDLGFQIISPNLPEQIFSGMLIEYRVRPLLGIPMKWVTEIANVDAPNKFTDKQLRGPYALWEHTHTFQAVQGGVKMTDEVRYALPLGWMGLLAHAVNVRHKLTQIFDYRTTVLKQLFGEIKK